MTTHSPWEFDAEANEWRRHYGGDDFGVVALVDREWRPRLRWQGEWLVLPVERSSRMGRTAIDNAVRDRVAETCSVS
jgi:hypothetical protein